MAKVESKALSLNLFVGEDWAGRPAVSPLDAQALVTGPLVVGRTTTPAG